MSEPEVIEGEVVHEEEKRLTVVKGGAVATVGNKGAAIEELNQIREFVASQLEDEIDFGVIPGTNDKKVLLLPGAQKVAMYFNVRPEYHVEKTELGNGHVEYSVSTTLFSRSTGEPVGAGVGSCSTMESKYRWRKGEGESTGMPVPKGYWDLRKENPAEAAKLLGGKGFTTLKTDAGWMIAKKGERTENPDIYDTRNTVLKMAKKRSLVDASVGLGCLSQFFTQDLEEREDDDHHEPPPRQKDAGSRPASHSTQATQPIPTPQPAKTTAPASDPTSVPNPFIGTIYHSEPAEPENKKPFKFDVKDANGAKERFSTFDTKTAQACDAYMGAATIVSIKWHLSKNGKLKNLDAVEEI